MTVSDQAPTVFWGPMAFAVMGGFAAATVLTLLFLPALYVAWVRHSRAGARSGRCRPSARGCAEWRVLNQIVAGELPQDGGSR